MIRVVALEDYLVDDLIDLVQDRRRDVESGSVIPGQPVADELSDLDRTLDALRNAETR